MDTAGPLGAHNMCNSVVDRRHPHRLCAAGQWHVARPETQKFTKLWKTTQYVMPTSIPLICAHRTVCLNRVLKLDAMHMTLVIKIGWWFMHTDGEMYEWQNRGEKAGTGRAGGEEFQSSNTGPGACNLGDYLGEDTGSVNKDAELKPAVLLWPLKFQALEYDCSMGCAMWVQWQAKIKRRTTLLG